MKLTLLIVVIMICSVFFVEMAESACGGTGAGCKEHGECCSSKCMSIMKEKACACSGAGKPCNAANDCCFNEPMKCQSGKCVKSK